MAVFVSRAEWLQRRLCGLQSLEYFLSDPFPKKFPISVKTALQNRARHMKSILSAQMVGFWAFWSNPVALYYMLDATERELVAALCVLSQHAELRWGNLVSVLIAHSIMEPLS